MATEKIIITNELIKLSNEDAQKASLIIAVQKDAHNNMHYTVAKNKLGACIDVTSEHAILKQIGDYLHSVPPKKSEYL